MAAQVLVAPRSLANWGGDHHPDIPRLGKTIESLMRAVDEIRCVASQLSEVELVDEETAAPLEVVNVVVQCFDALDSQGLDDRLGAPSRVRPGWWFGCRCPVAGPDAYSRRPAGSGTCSRWRGSADNWLGRARSVERRRAEGPGRRLPKKESCLPRNRLALPRATVRGTRARVE